MLYFVPAADLAEEGSASIAVLNPPSSASDPVAFTIADSIPQISATLTLEKERHFVQLTVSYADTATEAQTLLVNWDDGSFDNLKPGGPGASRNGVDNAIKVLQRVSEESHPPRGTASACGPLARRLR